MSMYSTTDIYQDKNKVLNLFKNLYSESRHSGLQTLKISFKTNAGNYLKFLHKKAANLYGQPVMLYNSNAHTSESTIQFMNENDIRY